LILTCIAATPPLAHAISQAGASRSGGAASGVVANVLGEALASGALQRHVAQVLRPAYARRWAYMCDAVHEHLVPLGASLPFARVDVRALYDGRGPRGRGAEVVPEGLLPAAVAGGYFVYVRLPPGISAAVLAARAEKRAGVVVQTEGMCLVPRVAGTSGELKGVPGGEGDRHVRLCFAWEDETVLVEGIHRLAGILRDILDGDDGPPFESVDRSGSAYS
jgi:DNA-binding transcriptional MocR family regulator